MEHLISHYLSNAQTALEMQMMLAGQQHQQQRQQFTQQPAEGQQLQVHLNMLASQCAAAVRFNLLPNAQKQMVQQCLLAQWNSQIQRPTLPSPAPPTVASNCSPQPLVKQEKGEPTTSRPDVIVPTPNVLLAEVKTETCCESPPLGGLIVDCGNGKEEGEGEEEANSATLLPSRSRLEQADVFVDVETLDEEEEQQKGSRQEAASRVVRPEHQQKKQRRAHILFYRKVKLIQRLAKGDQVTCALCKDVVSRSEHTLRSHVNGHSERPLFRCLFCAFESKQQADMYGHLTNDHHQQFSQKCYEDLRNMDELCSIASACFATKPNAAAASGAANKPSAALSSLLDELMERVAAKAVTKIKCHLCRKFVTASRAGLHKHAAGQHRHYRCRVCPKQQATTLRSRDALSRHLRASHQITTLKSNCYSNLVKPDLLAETLARCFPNYLKKRPDEQEEKKEATTEQPSNSSPKQ